jgi:hypothetical protein
MSDDYATSFQNFMLTGATLSTPKSARITTPEIVTVTESPHTRTAIKQCSNIVKAFQGTLQRDWLEVDDNLAAVVRSISNLRDRIYWSSQQLLAISCEASGDDWKTPRGARVYLKHQDIELALKHELQQHEQMMTGVRSLLTSLNQAQEALGRRLAEGMQLSLDIRANHYSRDKSISPLASIDALEHVYHILAVELYSKQVMVQDMLNCTNDYLFASDDDVVTTDENPRRVAHRCSTKWTSMSQQPEIKEVMSL